MGWLSIRRADEGEREQVSGGAGSSGDGERRDRPRECGGWRGNSTERA